MAHHLHADVAILGTGMGGGTLAWALRDCGAKVLLIERGTFLPKRTPKLGPDGGLWRESLQDEREMAGREWRLVFARRSLFRRRQHEGLRSRVAAIAASMISR